MINPVSYLPKVWKCPQVPMSGYEILSPVPQKKGIDSFIAMRQEHSIVGEWGGEAAGKRMAPGKGLAGNSLPTVATLQATGTRSKGNRRLMYHCEVPLWWEGTDTLCSIPGNIPRHAVWLSWLLLLPQCTYIGPAPHSSYRCLPKTTKSSPLRTDPSLSWQPSDKFTTAGKL